MKITPQEFFAKRPIDAIRDVDSAFINALIAELSDSYGISFGLTPNKVLTELRNALMYAYDNYQKMALGEKKVVVRCADIKKATNGLSYSFYLPNSVYAIANIQQTNAPFIGGLTTTALDIPMLRATANSFGGNLSVDTMRYNDYRVSDAVIALYEFSSYRTHLTKGVPYRFNNATGEFVLQVPPRADLILTIFERNDPSALYNDYYFKEYLLGRCLVMIGRTFGMFDMQLAGGASINAKDIKSEGQEKIKEVVDYWEKIKVTNRILYK